MTYQEQARLDARVARCFDELRGLYLELYRDEWAFGALCDRIGYFAEERAPALKRRDLDRESRPGWYMDGGLLGMAMVPQRYAGGLAGVTNKLPYLQKAGVTCVHPAQLPAPGPELAGFVESCHGRGIDVCADLTPGPTWDAGAFNALAEELLSLANCGVDVVRIGAETPGFRAWDAHWAHTLLRMVRLLLEIVCPGVLLLGDAESAQAADLFGTEARPECHLLYNMALTSAIWNTVATGDVRLLERRIRQDASRPRTQLFVNGLSSPGGLNWALDYGLLRRWGMEEGPHRRYLNAYFSGLTGDSPSRGALLGSGDEARFCGTTASMCGIEKALQDKDDAALALAVRLDLTLHAVMLFLSGVPTLRAGDELAQCNDYLGRGNALTLYYGTPDWGALVRTDDLDTLEGQVFAGLRRLEALRCIEPAFSAWADVWTIDTGSPAVLGVGRYLDGETMVGVFNFSHADKPIVLPEGGLFHLLHGQQVPRAMVLPPYGFRWLKQER